MAGNTLWDGGTLTALVDWDMAGTGPAGIDLSSLRCDAGQGRLDLDRITIVARRDQFLHQALSRLD